MADDVPQATITGAPDPALIGYWDNGTDWEALSCNTDANEAYFTSGSYAGCRDIRTSCQLYSASISTGSPDNNRIVTCDEDSECFTRYIHEQPTATGPDRNAKTNIFCAQNWRAFDIYRETQVTSGGATSSVQPSSGSEVATTGAPTSRGGEITTSSTGTGAGGGSQTGSPEGDDAAAGEGGTSPGVIAGATIGGVALALIIGFLIWFFGFHRRKQKGQPYQAAPQGGASPLAPKPGGGYYQPEMYAQEASGYGNGGYQQQQTPPPPSELHSQPVMLELPTGPQSPVRGSYR